MDITLLIVIPSVYDARTTTIAFPITLAGITGEDTAQGQAPIGLECRDTICPMNLLSVYRWEVL